MRCLALLPLALLAACAAAPPVPETPFTPRGWAAACAEDAGWDDPGPPMRLRGNSWWVGTCGIGAILITGSDGHVLIDSGTEAGAEVVLANLAALGIAPAEIKLLLLSHEHHDHGGGLARLQAATGARLLLSPAAAQVMASGRAGADDPQVGLNPGFAPVEADGVLRDGEAITLGNLVITPLATPGHTPGGMSYQWRACEGGDCRNIVYADSLTAISNDEYRFADHPAYVATFRAGLALLETAPCDMLFTPHPAASDIHPRAAAGLVADSGACRRYAALRAAQLDARLAREEQE